MKKKNLILIGAPGCGKGTLSEKLLAEEPLAHISTGDILRAEVKKETELGKKAAAIMKTGALLPDELVAGMVKARLAQPDCRNGFILDGFPRTVNQAKLLDSAFAELGMNFDAIVAFQVAKETLIRRLTSRLVCRACGAVYNRIGKPPKKDNVCDSCGGEVYQRADDSLETAQKRLAVYEEETAPVIDYYRASGKVIDFVSEDSNVSYPELKKVLN